MAVYQISEYGKIKSESETRNSKTEGDTIVPSRTFNNLWDFILENQTSNLETEKAFDLYTRGGKRVIKAKNYVGVIETKSKDVVEVLPKIYGVESISESKKIFLKMLSVLKGFNNLSFQEAGLQSKSDFPILELFISNYINEVERLILNGIKKGYDFKEDNLSFLKGNLKFEIHLRKNLVNKSKFYVKYSEFADDIPLNRILKSTLLKLLNITKSSINRRKISQLLNVFYEIPISSNVDSDLNRCSNSNRLVSDYERIIEWSEIFLLNKGFTNFSGKNINQAILFPMEKIFESFVSYQIKKHSSNYRVSTQHQKFHLIEKYREKPKFRLKPDIFVQGKLSQGNLIIDTKWKVIDETKKSTSIKQSDMYQLYAYGRKYLKGYEEPILFLIYPFNKKFTETLPPFYYEKEGDFWLKLYAKPFDLRGGYKEQVLSLLNSFNNSIDSVSILT
jgi:5-methylcytosine-specific restriction enzyme subunit McrC